MRDFNAGRDINVGGDLVIRDQSQQPGKLLRECSNDELLIERRRRERLLQEEMQRKWKKIFNWGLAAIISACIFYAIKSIGGKVDLVVYLLNLAGIVIPVSVTIRIADSQTEFQLRQLAALKEISFLLRERGTE